MSKTTLLPTIPWDDPAMIFDPGGCSSSDWSTSCARGEDESTVRTLNQLRGTMWSNIRCVDEARYLGVLFGHSITEDRIYAEALEKFNFRVAGYMHYKKAWMLYRRIAIANTFLTSIFSYLANFHVIPAHTRSAIRKGTCRFVLPLSPTSIGINLLKAPALLFGFRTPLRGIHMQTAATILSHVDDLRTIEDHPDEHHLSILHNRAVARSFYREWGGELACDVLPPRDKLDPKSVSHIAARYRHMNESARSKAWYMKGLKAKFSLAVGPNDTAAIVLNFASTLKLVPEYIRHTTYDLLMHTLPTAYRMPKVVPYKLCRLCHRGRDMVRHIFGLCPTYRAALSAAADLRFHPLPGDVEGTLSCASLGTPLSVDSACLLMCFNFAVWIVHQHHREDHLHRPCDFLLEESYQAILISEILGIYQDKARLARPSGNKNKRSMKTLARAPGRKRARGANT